VFTGSPPVFPNLKLPLMIEQADGVIVADETCSSYGAAIIGLESHRFEKQEREEVGAPAVVSSGHGCSGCSCG